MFAGCFTSLGRVFVALGLCRHEQAEADPSEDTKETSDLGESTKTPAQRKDVGVWSEDSIYNTQPLRPRLGSGWPISDLFL